MTEGAIGTLHRNTLQLVENEACFQTMMLTRREPSRWRELFNHRQAGLTWAQTLAAMQARKNGQALAA